jgi:hypothetical protein
MYHAMANRDGKLANLRAQERDDLVERFRHSVDFERRPTLIDQGFTLIPRALKCGLTPTPSIWPLRRRSS